MAQTIKIRRTTGNAAPASPATVAQGELFYAYGSGGTYGKRLAIGHQSGGTNTPEIVGGSYYTGIIDTAASANTASKLVLRDGSGNFSAGTITAALTGTASNAAGVTLANEGSDTTTFLVFSNDATGNDKALKTNAGLAFDTSNGTLTASTFSGNVNATTIAGTLSTAAQTNITSVGTLGALTVTGDITLGGTIVDTGNLTLDVGGNIEFNADGGTISFKDDGATLATLTSSGFSVTTLTGTLSTAAQPNITSLGTLTSLTVDDITINGSSITDGGNLSLDSGGNITIDADGGTITFADGGVSLGTITSSGYSGTSATATALATARNLVLSGDGSATFSSFDGTGNVSASLTLATVYTGNSSRGSSTQIPVLTIDGKGRITAASQAAISTTLDIAADSGTDNGVALGTDTLTVSGGTGVATSVSGDTITVAIAQDVSTSATPTFGTITTSGELRGPASFTIDPAAIGDNTGTVIIKGDLTVQGDTTTVNSNTVNIGDNILVLNNDETGTPSQDAGLEVERGTSANAKLQYVEGSDLWKLDVGGGAGLVETVLTSTNFNAQYSGVIDGGVFS